MYLTKSVAAFSAIFILPQVFSQAVMVVMFERGHPDVKPAHKFVVSGIDRLTSSRLTQAKYAKLVYVGYMKLRTWIAECPAFRK